MRKFFALLTAFFIIAAAPAAFAATDFGMKGEEFLAQMASVFYRVRGGFNSNSVSRAEHTPDGLLLPYGDAIFLAVNEKPGSREVRSVSAVLLTPDAAPERQYTRGIRPSDVTLYENVCLQVIYALNPKISDAQGQDILEKLGGNALFFDGKQRSTYAGDYRCILRLHENGMAVMIVDKIE